MNIELVGKLLFYVAILLGTLIIGLAAAVEHHWVSVGIEASWLAVAGVIVVLVLLPIALALERSGRS